MKFLSHFEIREKFINFFKKYNHEIVPSSSLIPAQDPTLLFTNAGMNQFKDIFLAKEKRSYNKAATIQKCIRAGGKHNDLDNVGFTKRHLTFFEMLGNFSFGDYFKKEAINYAWDFLTNWVNLPADKLYVSIYFEDEQAYSIWTKDIGIEDSKIYRLSEKDNFWQMGDTGPCGPCSEIYIDRGPDFGCKKFCGPGCHCDRFLEIWNLVFMQYDRQKDGNLNQLTSKGIDTGMGLERLCSIVQNTNSVYETDLFMPIIHKLEDLTKISYLKANDFQRSAFRVLADHVRSSVFAISDGVIPSNEGRGYVVRKIIRRAALFSQKIDTQEQNIFIKIIPEFIDYMAKVYPELKNNQSLIMDTITSEIEKFSQNLLHGQNILSKYIEQKIKDNTKRVITSDEVFKLYDTYGFPIEITQLIAKENNFDVDIKDFDKYMQEQKMRSGKKLEDLCVPGQDLYTKFTGYDEYVSTAKIISLIVDNKQVNEVSKNKKCYVITDISPFYVECGGQVSDQGFIKIGQDKVPLLGLKKIGNSIAAYIEVPTDLKIGEIVTLYVDLPTRINTMKNHTATHMLQAALIDILGNKVKQAGSVVHPDYLRFDFTYSDNISQQQLLDIENLVNMQIMKNIPLVIRNTSLKNATDEGVIAFFGEKYNPESVRIVEIPGFSKELCGGTHVKATGDIGIFKIVELSTLASGIKRILALTGPKALELFQTDFNIIKNLINEFKVPQDKILDAIDKQKIFIKEYINQIKKLKSKLYKLELYNWVKNIEFINSMPFLYLNLEDIDDINDLKNIALELNKNQSGLYFVSSNNNITGKTIFFMILDNKYKSKIDLQSLLAFFKQNNLHGGLKDNIIQGGGLININNDFISKFKDKIKENFN